MTMFSLTEDNKGKSLAVFYGNGDTDTIPETHVSFKAIIEKLISGSANDDEIRELSRIIETTVRKMSALSERVSVDGKEVYFDGDPLRGEISDIIKGMFEDGRTLDFKPLVNFLEKAKTNPSLKSIDDLYRWIKKGDLVIDPDGDIVAYKGVAVNDEGISVSIHSGTAFVNGEEITGQIPNVPGTVISMARSTVDTNEFVGCSYGLHAGTYDYAKMFLSWNGAHRLILVKINPRDVVSVPFDEQDRKMRVSRYTVLTQIEERINEPFYQPELPLDDTDDEDLEDDEDYYDDEDPFGTSDCECGCNDDEEDDDDEEEPEEDSEDETEAPEQQYRELAEWERELLGLPPVVVQAETSEEFFTKVITDATPVAPKSMTEILQEAVAAANEAKIERDSNGRRIS